DERIELRRAFEFPQRSIASHCLPPTNESRDIRIDHFPGGDPFNTARRKSLECRQRREITIREEPSVRRVDSPTNFFEVTKRRDQLVRLRCDGFPFTTALRPKF